MNHPDIIAGHYQVIRKLGSGGFGDTFLAEDIHLPSKRICVVKQLKPIQNNPQIYQLVKERFQREAITLEGLGTHPQIPELFAYFEENGQFYLVQEYVEGETLIDLMRTQGVQPEAVVKRLTVEILEILEYIQTKRIIHRDIKPENILLRASDRKPVLIDFGAVRETMSTQMASTGQATSSIVIGTPGFMPSEQASGRPVFSSDLYALGLTAIYLLTGKVPQDLETDPRTGDFLLHTANIPVDQHFLEVLNTAVKAYPKERFHTAAAMKAALIQQYTTPQQSMDSTLVAASSTVVGQATNVTPSTDRGLPKSGLLALGAIAVFGLGAGALYIQQQNRNGGDRPVKISETNPSPNANPVVNQGTGINPALEAQQKKLEQQQEEIQKEIEDRQRQIEQELEAKQNPQPENTPTPQPTVSSERVSFVPGTTGSVMDGVVTATTKKRYLLWCGKDQLFSVQIDGNVNIVVKAPNGAVLTRLSGSDYDQIQLPSSGDYSVEVSSSEYAEYRLSIDVL